MFKKVVETIVLSLVEYPDQASITELVGTGSVVIEIKVAESDIGRVIGRNGRVINAIRTLMQSLGTKEGKRVTVEVL